MRDKVSQATLALAKAYTDEHGGGGGGGADNYNDLTHKPTLNGVEIKGTLTGASLGLVNAEDGKSLSTNDYSNTDKAIVGGVTDALAGKQDTISDLSTIRSGASAGASAYQKPTTGIPKTDLASAVQTSLEKADSAVQDVSGKADKVLSATNGNFAGLDSNGNLTDSGKKASDFLPSNTPIPSTANCYESTDTEETALADDDYFPFYDTSASGKRKTLWSNIKWKIYEYITSHFRAGLINDNGYISTETSNFSVEDSGTASQNSVREQVINYTTNSVGGSAINMVTVNGSKYMEQTINAQANTDTTFTFSSSELTYASVLDIFAGCKTADYAIPTLKSKTLSVSGNTGTLTLVYNVPTAYALTVRVYIRG